MIYEIINPSDPVTIEASDSLLASVAIIMLGKGDYGLYDEDERVVVPIFRFSKPEILIGWLHTNGIYSDKMDEFYAKNGEELATILESAVYGNKADREAITALTEKMSIADRITAIARWNNSKQTSANGIVAAALALADSIRAKAQELHVP